MKTAIFEKPGLENLKIKLDIEEPKITDHDVLVKVKMAGINPIDHFAISGTRETKSLSQNYPPVNKNTTTKHTNAK